LFEIAPARRARISSAQQFRRPAVSRSRWQTGSGERGRAFSLMGAVPFDTAQEVAQFGLTGEVRGRELKLGRCGDAEPLHRRALAIGERVSQTAAASQSTSSRSRTDRLAQLVWKDQNPAARRLSRGARPKSAGYRASRLSTPTASEQPLSGLPEPVTVFDCRRT
jgi:hypothetical protein